MRFLWIATLIAASSIVAAVEIPDQTTHVEADSDVIDEALKRVDHLVPEMGSDALGRARNRAAALKMAAEKRQELAIEDHSFHGKKLESEWRNRWSVPVNELVESEEPVKPQAGDSDNAMDSAPGLSVNSVSSGTIIESSPIEDSSDDIVLGNPLTVSERDALVSEGVTAFGNALQASAKMFGLRPAFLLCVMRIESAFDPAAISHAGAIGLMQLMPTTADELGTNPYDLTENILGGARLINSHLEQYGGDVAIAMAAYNAGPGAVERFGGVPPYPETQNYVAKILRTCGEPRP